MAEEPVKSSREEALLKMGEEAYDMRKKQAILGPDQLVPELELGQRRR
jgi:hypothetical protein